MKKGLIPFAVMVAFLAIEAIPAEAQMISQKIARSLPPVQNALNMGVRMIPARRANPGGMRNGLPPTNMDSFVYESGAKAWHIYGDEGVHSIPPFMEFTKEHRIEAGINGRRRKGLTTGHGSHLPDAWGGDEFVDGPEWSDSGAGGTRSQFQPFEQVVQDLPLEEVYQTPPFIDDQTDPKSDKKPTPKTSLPKPLKEALNEMSQDTNQQAMFGRQPGKSDKPNNLSQESAFNWP